VRRLRGLLLASAPGCAIILTATIPPARADDDTSRAEISAALTQWTDDFNAGRADKVCDLFARDLRADFRGQPERGMTRSAACCSARWPMARAPFPMRWR